MTHIACMRWIDLIVSLFLLFVKNCLHDMQKFVFKKADLTTNIIKLNSIKAAETDV